MIRLLRQSIFLMVIGTLLLGACQWASAAPLAPGSYLTTEPVKDAVADLARPGSTRTRNGIKTIGGSLPVTGIVKVLAVPVEFTPDVDPNTSGTGTFPYRTWGPASQPGYLDSRLQAVARYYSEVSGNRITLVPTLTGVVRLANPLAKYSADAKSVDPKVFSGIIKEVVAAIDGQVDFSNYDAIMLIHAGAASENAVAATTDFTSIYQRMPNGVNIPTSDPAVIVGWAIVPETMCNDTIFKAANPLVNIQAYEQDKSVAPNAFIPHYWDVVGPWAHELGHAFGLPDLYDVKVAGGFGLGYYSLMGIGDYLPVPDPTEPGFAQIPFDANRPYFASCPAHLDAWSKQLLGWSSVVNVTGRLVDQSIPAQAGSTGTIYRMWTNGDTSSSEYFLVENREKVGFDKYLPAAGLMVYHIDDAVGTILLNNMQADPNHPRVLPLLADNTPVKRFPNPLNLAQFEFIPGVDPAFPGTVNNMHIGSATTPSSLSYASTNTFVDISNIHLAGNAIIATLQTGTGGTISFTNPLPGAVIYVTKPVVGIIAPNMDSTTLTVTLNGQTLISTAIGNVATYYNAGTGQLTVPLDGSLAGPLPVGDYQVVVTAQDTMQNQTVTQTLNFSVREKTLAAAMQMISLPATNVGTVPTVFVGQQTFELARWNPLTGAYATYPDAANYTELTNPSGAAYDRADPTHVLAPAGKAYWVRKMNSATALRLAGDLVPSDRQFVVPTVKGFNMIGNPYNFTVAFGSLLVEYNGKTYSVSEAAQANLLDPVLYSWSGQAYATAVLPNGLLDPWVGYWIHCSVGTAANPLKLVFQPVPAGRLITVTAPMRVRGAAGTWEMDVKAVSLSGTGTSQVTLGVLPQATGTLDRGVDLYAPPAVPGGVMLASTATGTGEALMRDYRGAASTLTWELAVTAPAGSTVSLSWPDLTRLPAGTLVTLSDPVTGSACYLRTTPSYTLTLGANETSRQLTLAVTSGAVGAFRVQELQVQQTRGTSGARISCRVTLPAQVTVEIRSATGSLIRRLSAGTRAADVVALLWDGKDAHGRAVPHGAYQCQVLAVTENGQSAKAMALMPPL